MRANPRVKTPSDYLAILPEPRRKILRTIHKAIRAGAPRLKPRIMHGMSVTACTTTNTPAAARGDWFFVGLASQKNYVSLYICACDKDGYLAENNQSRLGKVSVGRSSIRFKALED